MKRDTSNDVNMNSADLKAWMDKYGYTVEELADKLGLTRQAVIYWLNGKRVIPEPMGRLFNLFDLNKEAREKF